MVAIETDDQTGDSRYRGLLHYRGRVMPVFEPVVATDAPLDPDWFLVVLDDDHRQLALIARQIDDIVQRNPDHCRTLEVGDGQTVTVVSFDDEVVRVIEPGPFLNDNRPVSPVP